MQINMFYKSIISFVTNWVIETKKFYRTNISQWDLEPLEQLDKLILLTKWRTSGCLPVQ